MAAPVSVREDQLTRLVALSPGSPADARIAALVRRTCAQTLSLAALPSPVEVGAPESETEAVVAEFAEQFSVDVSMITGEQRSRLWKHLGDSTIGAVMSMYIADFVPRVRAGLEALGVGEQYLGWVHGTIPWDHSDPSDAVLNDFLPAVARMRALDPVITELVRLRGATQHNCRLCKSLRDGNALDVGGSESLYADIERYETSERLSERHKAALRYVDAMIWKPARISSDVAAGVRKHFSEEEAFELTLDVMRNATNKIAVSLAADAPRVSEGTELYVIDADGQTVFAR
jgi:alkylhydroperoxidase family enzyme